jgi:hypothetical protein
MSGERPGGEKDMREARDPTIRLGSHMVLMSVRQIRFAVAMPEESKAGVRALHSVSGLISYDLFKAEPHTSAEAGAVFARNRDAVLAGFGRAFRQAMALHVRKPNTDSLVVNLVAADLPRGLLT